MISRYVSAPLVALAVTVAGCASSAPPGDEAFSNVSRSVAERGGHRVHWNRGTHADAEALESVRQLLAAPLTPDAAVQVALLNNPSLQATYEDVGVAQAQLVGAGLLSNPVFDGEARFGEGGSGTGLELTVTQDFLDVFQIPLRKRLATDELRMAELRTADAVLNLAAEVREAYYAAQGATQLLELRKTAAEATGASADFAKRLRDAGNVPELDRIAEQALHESAMIELTSAQAEVEQARQRLATLMGVIDDNVWTLPPRLADTPAEAFDVAAIETVALDQRLDLRAADHRIRFAQRSLGGAKRYGAVDHVEVGGGADREPGDEWSFGPNLVVPIPLFNQGQSRIASARAELRRARAQRDATALTARSEVRTAASKVAAAQQRVARLRDVILPLRQRVLEQTVLQYNAMNVGVFDLLRAKQEQIGAAAQYVEALHDYWTARSKLTQAAGGQLPVRTITTTQPATAPASVPTSAPADAHQHHHHH